MILVGLKRVSTLRPCRTAIKEISHHQHTQDISRVSSAIPKMPRASSKALSKGGDSAQVTSENASNQVGSPPKRSADGAYHFDDFPQLLPNRSPKEILQAGSFGGTYFRPIKSAVCPKSKFGDEVWKELPQDWMEGLDPKKRICSSIYRPEVNKYGVKCGGSLQMWEESGWIKPQDPYGWFQWYCRFFQGRRTEDDARQVARWVACAGERSGRWRNRLCSLVWQKGGRWNDTTISPVIRQTLLHWGYELTEEHFKRWGRRQGAEPEMSNSAAGEPAKSKKVSSKTKHSGERSPSDEGGRGKHEEPVENKKATSSTSKRVKVSDAKDMIESTEHDVAHMNQTNDPDGPNKPNLAKRLRRGK